MAEDKEAKEYKDEYGLSRKENLELMGLEDLLVHYFPVGVFERLLRLVDLKIQKAMKGKE